MTTTRTLTALAVTGGLWLAACGSDDTGEADQIAATTPDADTEQDDESATNETTLTTSTAALDPTEAEEEDASSPGTSTEREGLPDATLAEITDDSTQTFTFPALGGVRFAVSDEHRVGIANDLVTVQIDQPVGGLRPEANVALVTQSVALAPISNIDDYMGAVETDPEATVEPTGDAIDLFGFRLVGYEIANNATAEEPMLFATNRLGADVAAVASPFPYARVYLAETPAGVLQASIEGTDAEHAQLAAGAFSLLINSIELTGDGLSAPLPPGELLESSAAGPPPDPIDVVAGGADALLNAFSPVNAATYQLPNTGLPTTIDITDDWFVQPNFPGIVILTDPESRGPGDRDLVIIRNVTEYLQTGAGPHAVGPIQPITTIDEFLADPPSEIEISGIAEVDFGTNTGLQFDAVTAPEADCSDDEPCEISLVTTYGFIKTLQANHAHRLWWIDTPDGPLVMIAAAFGDEGFIDRATELALSLRFL